MVRGPPAKHPSGPSSRALAAIAGHPHPMFRARSLRRRLATILLDSREQMFSTSISLRCGSRAQAFPPRSAVHDPKLISLMESVSEWRGSVPPVRAFAKARLTGCLTTPGACSQVRGFPHRQLLSVVVWFIARV